MDPDLVKQANAGWAAHFQNISNGALNDNRALGVLVATSMVTPSSDAQLNLAARTPTTVDTYSQGGTPPTAT